MLKTIVGALFSTAANKVVGNVGHAVGLAALVPLGLWFWSERATEICFRLLPLSLGLAVIGGLLWVIILVAQRSPPP